jgi:hypothetical protein
LGKYWRVIGHYNGESQTFEALAGTFQASPYTPDEDARLAGIRLICAPEAATSLVENYQIRLTSTTFKPNTLHVGGCGNGLATAPSVPAPVMDYEIDQPVKAGVPITLEGRHAVATAVTANILVMGCFQS